MPLGIRIESISIKANEVDSKEFEFDITVVQ